jgi:hypothetical protein
LYKEWAKLNGKIDWEQLLPVDIFKSVPLAPAGHPIHRARGQPMYDVFSHLIYADMAKLYTQ